MVCETVRFQPFMGQLRSNTFELGNVLSTHYRCRKLPVELREDVQCVECHSPCYVTSDSAGEDFAVKCINCKDWHFID